MITLMFTVYDDKTEAYFPPFYAKTRGEAIRMFTDSCNDPSHMFNKHSADYTLFFVGNFDDQVCGFDLEDTPSSLGKAIEFKKSDLTTPRQALQEVV